MRIFSLTQELITGICKGQYHYSGNRLTYMSECFRKFFFLENFTGIWDVK